MSYILDALRRADAERERGAVPSLQSQQHSIAEDDAVAARPKPLVWAVVALAIALAAALAWMFFGGSPAPARAPVEGAVAPVPTPLPSLQPAPVATPAPMAATPSPVPAPTAPSTAALPPPPLPSVTAQPPPALRASAETKRPAPRPTPTSPPTVAAKEPGGARVYAPGELPDEIRRELPKIAIAGSSYSGDAASRMVMINGQVFHEGDRLAPDLVLERIRLKSAVFAFKGWRYEVAF